MGKTGVGNAGYDVGGNVVALRHLGTAVVTHLFDAYTFVGA